METPWINFFLIEVKFANSEMHRARIYSWMGLEKCVFLINQHRSQDAEHFRYAPFQSMPLSQQHRFLTLQFP